MAIRLQTTIFTSFTGLRRRRLNVCAHGGTSSRGAYGICLLRRYLSPLNPGPLMMSVAAIEQGDQRTGVDNDLVFHWPKFRR